MLKRKLYKLLNGTNQKDVKGNSTLTFTEIGSFRGGYIKKTSSSDAEKEYGFKDLKINGVLKTRSSLVNVNQYIKTENEEIYHIKAIVKTPLSFTLLMELKE